MLNRVVTNVLARFATAVQKRGGRLFTWEAAQEPKQVIRLDSPVKKISTGKEHALIQTESGVLYGYGSNANGQLAGNSAFCRQPEPIEYFSKLRVRNFSCGDYHNLVALQDGTVVSWGSIGPWNPIFLNATYIDGNCLGLGKSVFSTKEPTVIEGLDEVEQVAAGDRFSLALKRDGRVFGWGSVHSGRLLQPSDYIYTPQELVDLTRFLNKKHTHIVKICSAYGRTVFLCDNGKLYTFGLSFEGNTGHRPNELINEGNELDQITPVVDELFRGDAVEDFKISGNALILRTKSGGIFYSGMGVAYKPHAFPYSVRNVKNIFATEDSVGVVSGTAVIHSDDNKIYYIVDKIIKESDRCPQTKVYISEEAKLEGDVQQIGGKYHLKYAIVA